MWVLNGEIVDRGGKCIEISDKLSSVDCVNSMGSSSSPLLFSLCNNEKELDIGKELLRDEIYLKKHIL